MSNGHGRRGGAGRVHCARRTTLNNTAARLWYRRSPLIRVYVAEHGRLVMRDGRARLSHAADAAATTLRNWRVPARPLFPIVDCEGKQRGLLSLLCNCVTGSCLACKKRGGRDARAAPPSTPARLRPRGAPQPQEQVPELPPPRRGGSRRVSLFRGGGVGCFVSVSLRLTPASDPARPAAVPFSIFSEVQGSDGGALWWRFG